ncbi:hypothetical protein [Maribacter sp. ACAM166]|uniref:hypothetical protein n=1 Tax=Maribacter sp. ACAM166 TaxID=2508996 RepID=UPI0010FD1C28|nr:hypothetical protein [Maribacter sp. ACAM166]TLP77295.1 hypothetical protein ES765_12675 [Maribacter sp. ACAM166]
MKSVLKCMLLLVLVSSCSKIELNDDPIIGIWKHSVKTATNTNKMVIDNEEWIFNDVYMGRFHGYRKGQVVFLTDFKWSVENGTYIVRYPGTDFPDDLVEMKETEDGTVLIRAEGKIFAQKEKS